MLYFLFQECKNVSLDRTSLSKLHWQQFSKYHYEAIQLPPIVSALKYKIFRSQYVNMVLKKSHVLKENPLSPERCGWDLNGTSLDPIMTDNLPAPLALTELSIYNCKGGCSTRRCKCFKNSLACTQCSACNNSDTFEEDDQDIFEYEESGAEDYS